MSNYFLVIKFFGIIKPVINNRKVLCIHSLSFQIKKTVTPLRDELSFINGIAPNAINEFAAGRSGREWFVKARKD